MKRIVTWSVTGACLAVCGTVVVAILSAGRARPAAVRDHRRLHDRHHRAGLCGLRPLVPVSTLKAGDIITFVPPGMSSPVTHRIVEHLRRSRVSASFAPRATSTRWPTPGASRFLSRPWRGTRTTSRIWATLLALLSLRPLRMLLIGLPALVIAISLLWSLWRSAGEEVRAQDEARRPSQQAVTVEAD